MNFSLNLRPALFSLLTLGTWSLAAPAQAQQLPTPVRVAQVDHENLRLRIANPAQQRSRVEVVHLNTGQPLFAETYTDAAYGHRFNFRDLPAGRYALKLKVGPDRYNYTIQVASTSKGPKMAISELETRQVTPVLASAGE